MAVSFGMAACSGQQREAPEAASDPVAAGEAPGEHPVSEGGGEHAGREGTGEHAGSEHGDEHGEHGLESEGEESGIYIGREQTWDTTTRRGARLVLSFDAASNAFVGTVENATQQLLCAVRVEVHLSSGTELGPTERTDLQPGEQTSVQLPTEGEAFDTWTAHPEVSACSGG